MVRLHEVVHDRQPDSGSRRSAGTLRVPLEESRDERLGHPLAGVEETGWNAADPLLFRDAPWALTLEDDTPLEPWLRLAELVCDLGAKPVPTTASEQDAAVARVIGLPHVLAEALALTGLAVVPEILGPEGPGRTLRINQDKLDSMRLAGERPKELSSESRTGAGRFSLLNEPQPLRAADADMDFKVTREEWARAALDRFTRLDANKDGSLTLAEMEPRLP